MRVLTSTRSTHILCITTYRSDHAVAVLVVTVLAFVKNIDLPVSLSNVSSQTYGRVEVLRHALFCI